MGKNRGKESWVTGNYRNTKFHVRSGAAPDLTVRATWEDFQVHRSILSARSPVFAAMLGGNFKVGCQPWKVNRYISDIKRRNLPRESLISGMKNITTL